MMEFASGMKRFNATESYMKHLEAQGKQSRQQEYSWDVELKAADGASVDPAVERERQRLAKQSAERKAKEEARIKRENARNAAEREKDAVVRYCPPNHTQT